MLSPKTPSEIKDYGFEWEDGLTAGDTIATSTWVVAPTGGLTIGDTVRVGTVTLARLSAGTAGTSYTLTNTITTIGGETLVAALIVEVMTPVAAAGL